MIKAEEEEEDVRLKAEEEDQLAEGARLKVEDHERVLLKVEGGSVSTLNLDGERRSKRSKITHG